MNKYWVEGEFEKSKLGMTAKFAPTCPFHPRTLMYIKDCKLLNFSLRDDDVLDSNALDVVLGCPECGYIDIFGIAVSKEYRAQVREMVENDKKQNIGVYTNIVRAEASDGNLADNKWMDVYG